MPILYSYCVPFDNGATPNPFWGVCTLNICKPVIRRIAEVGDWIVGTGSSKFGFEGKVIYAMKVTQKMTMRKYYDHCKVHLSNKIPDWVGKSYKKRAGDCIYDFSTNPATILKSVHNEGNRQRDEGGEYTLLSDSFYYFGNRPQQLPKELLPIVHQGQGHKSKSNQPHFNDFVNCILTQTQAWNQVYSEPNDGHLLTLEGDYLKLCAKQCKDEEDADEVLTNE